MSTASSWRTEITEDSRKELITKMFHELSRVSGETDRNRIWSSAAKFELMLWNDSESKSDYMHKLAKKIHTLTKKPSVQPRTGQTPTSEQIPAAQPQSSPMMTSSSFQNPTAQTQLQLNPTISPPPQPSASAVTMTSGAANPEQQLQILLHNERQLTQTIAQMQSQRNQIIVQQQAQAQAQQQQYILQSHRLQQQQQTQNCSDPMRQQQTQQLQAQQQMHRQNFQQKQQHQLNVFMQNVQTNQHHLQQVQQSLQQIRQKHANVVQVQQKQQQQQQLRQAQLQVSAQQQEAAAQQQAQQRAQQRTQNDSQQAVTSSMNNGSSAASQNNGSSPPTASQAAYTAKVQQLKSKYWGDLVLVFREFTKLAAQPKTSPAAIAQQEKVKQFLNNLKRAMQILNETPTESMKRQYQDLERVEQHIIRIILPILVKLKNEQVKKRQMAETTTTSPVQTSSTTPSSSSTVPISDILSSAGAPAGSSNSASPLPQESSTRTTTPSLTTSITSTQYRSFKLTPSQKIKLQTSLAKLKQQAEKLAQQQQRAKTPVSQARYVQQAQKVAQNISRTSQQLAQGRLAEEYELLQQKQTTHAQLGKPTVSLTTAPSHSSSRNKSSSTPSVLLKTKKSVVPNSVEPLTSSQRLLASVQAYEQVKPEVLRSAAKEFLELSHVTGGFHLTLSSMSASVLSS